MQTDGGNSDAKVYNYSYPCNAGQMQCSTVILGSISLRERERGREYSEMHAEINTYTGSDQGLWNGKRVMQRDIGGIGSLHT